VTGADTAQRETALRSRLRELAGTTEAHVAFAPGRINLIGEHTDYTGGWVLPAGLALGTWVAAAPNGRDSLTVYSESQQEAITLPLNAIPAQTRRHWSDYVAGVAWSLQQTGRILRGATLYICSDIPIGSGLSSSASLEVAVARALLTVADLQMAPVDIALACQRAENEYVGARCGIMDQFAATHARRGQALLLDCGNLAWAGVPLPTTHRWIVANTMVRHALAYGEYNVRRAECETVVAEAARLLPHRRRLADLDHVEAARLARILSPRLAARLRHVVSENRRVLETVRMLHSGDVAGVGRLLVASHQSLRDDFNVSCPELDSMVELAMPIPGVVGTRMIGGGFGGCTLSLVTAAQADIVVERLGSAYARLHGRKPSVFICDLSGAEGSKP